MDLTQEDVLQILKIMDESDYEMLHLEVGELKLVVNKGCSSQGTQEVSAPMSGEVRKEIETNIPVDLPTDVVPLQAERSIADELAELEGLIPIRSPMLGTFYRSSGPGDPPLVKAGQLVKEETNVCIIEVMKLFSTIQAGVRGRISKICAEDGQLVEYNQILFLVEPQLKNGEI